MDNIHNNSNNKRSVAKILVMGSNDKRSVIQRYVHKSFNDEKEENVYDKSLASSFSTKCLRIKNEGILKLQIWDIANQDRFIGLAENYYRYACGCIIVFDITRKDSLLNALKWKMDLDSKVRLKNGQKLPCILVANKYDLVEENDKLSQFNDNELDEFCSNNQFIGWFYISAKTGMNIKQSFNTLIKRIIHNKKKMDRNSSPSFSSGSSGYSALSGLSSSEIATPKYKKSRSYTLDGLLSYFKTTETENENENFS